MFDNPPVWRSHHGLLGDKLEPAFEKLSEFLKENVGEIIILELSHFQSFTKDQISRTTERDGLGKMVQSIFGSLLWPFSQGMVSYSECIKNGYRVMVIFDDSDVARKYNFWPPESVYNAWPNVIGSSALVLKYHNEQVANLNNWYADQKNSLSIWKTGWQQTPDANWILKSLKSLPKRVLGKVWDQFLIDVKKLRKNKYLQKVSRIASERLKKVGKKLRESKQYVANQIRLSHKRLSEGIKDVKTGTVSKLHSFAEMVYVFFFK